MTKVITGSLSTSLALGSAGIYFLLALAVLFKKREHYGLFQWFVWLGIPLAVLAVAAGHHFAPQAIDKFSMEDGPIEYLSAASVLAAALMWAGFAVFKFKSKQWLLAGGALFMGLIMFLIGMEEISWGQRIFNIESGEFFLENNMQAEMNLHNLDTRLSETLLYAGGVICLIMVPFFRKNIARLMNKTKSLAKLEVFLPSAWISVPFLALLGLFGRFNIADRPLVLLAFAFGFGILIHYFVAAVRSKETPRIVYMSIMTAIVVVAAFTFFNFINFEALQIRGWYYTEYLEFFIEVGLLVYTIDFMFRNTALFKNVVGKPSLAE